MANPNDEPRTVVNIKGGRVAAWDRARAASGHAGETLGSWVSRACNQLADLELPEVELELADGSPVNGAPPDLGLVLRQMRDEFADFRDQLTVLAAICMRVEATLQALTVEVRVMHSRYDRLRRRVTELEGET
jgi:hypothetical protein